MHTSSEPTIVEVAESDLVSGTEAISTTETINAVSSPLDDMSLEGLFAELKNSTNKAEAKDELTKIKDKVEALPKIEDKLQHQYNTGKTTKQVEIINDPLVHKVKPTKAEDAGDKWFHMKQPELTPEVKRDLLIIKQRNALDPKRHYKKDKWETPKFFQTGTIIEGNTEFYSSRLKRKERGKTLVDELLHSESSQKYFKRKYTEIQQTKTSGGKAHYKKIRSMRKKF